MKVNSNVKIKPLDYSSSLNWLIKEDDGEKEVDVFYLYPTAVPLDCEDKVGEINDIVKENAMIGYKKGQDAFLVTAMFLSRFIIKCHLDLLLE